MSNRARNFTALFAGAVLLCAPLHSSEPAGFRVGAFEFQPPTQWTVAVPSSPMRKAELHIPGPGGEAEAVFFHFGPGEGGSVDANIRRWLGQFEESPEHLQAHTATQAAGRTEVHFVKAKGTFLSGMPGGPTDPKKDYALRGAILADPTNGDVFVKLTGPAATVEAADDAFVEMVMKSASNR